MSRTDPSSGARRLAAARALALFWSLCPAPAIPGGDFIRGDATADGRLDLSDPISSLLYLFAGGPSLSCADAADFDDSGSLDIGDPVRALGYLFRGGPAPGHPFPAAGPDPTPDGLGCSAHPDEEEPAMAFLPIDLEDMERAAAPSHGPPASEAGGSPLSVDGETFQALLAVAPGGSVLSSAVPDGEALLASLFGGIVPPRDGPAAVAVDLVAPVGPEGCYRVPPDLIDGGSHDSGLPGSFRRGDVDRNGLVEAADARALASCLSVWEGCPEGCWDAADADDDGQVGLSDVEEILLSAFGEVALPPPGAASCGVDPTEDGLPGCGEVCAESPGSLFLVVEPEVVCGPGPHPVRLIVIDDDGNRAWARSTVSLCRSGEEGCPDSPQRSASPGEGGAGSGVACRWILTVDYDPLETESELRQNVFDQSGGIRESRHGLPLAAGGAMELWRTDNGPGPDHYLYAGRLSASCGNPPSELSLVKSGQLQLRLGLVCIKSDGTRMSCKTQVELEGIYRSRVEAGTSAGPECRSGPNRVEGLAQDETQLTANASPLFAKGVSVQNGNSITTAPSFSREVSVGVGGTGIAANSAIKEGRSETTVHATGRSEDLLDAFGNWSGELPLTARMNAKGKVELQAHNRTWTRVKCRTLVAGVWLVARTDCPLDPIFLCEVQGEEEEKQKAKELARNFRLTRLGQ